MMIRYKLKIKMGSVILEIQTNLKSIVDSIDSKYLGFISKGAPDLIVKVNDAKEQFSSNKSSKMNYDVKRNIITFSQMNVNVKYYIDDDLIYFRLNMIKDYWEYFMNALSFIFRYYLIYKRKGLLLHASGLLKKNNKAIIFAGPSGSGKTFLAQYYNKKHGYIIMSDESMLLQKKDKRIFAYSTIFAGKEDTLPINKMAEIEEINFIRYSAKPKKILQQGIFVLRELLENNLISYYAIKNPSLFQNKQFVKNYFYILDKMALNIRCYEFFRKKI